MIYDKFENIPRYLGADPVLDAALKDIRAGLLSASLLGGKVTCGGAASTVTAKEGVFEYHALKADIHLVLSGEERIDFAPAEAFTETKAMPDKDAWLGNAETYASVVLRPGWFLLVYPYETHRVKQAVTEPCAIEKVVYKLSL